jgi:hypothetical protein
MRMDAEDASHRWNLCNAAVETAAYEIDELRKKGETAQSCRRLLELENLCETARRELEEIQRDAGWTSDWR